MKAPIGKELEWDLAYALMMPSKRRNLGIANKIMSSLPERDCSDIIQKGCCLRMLRKYDEADKFFSERLDDCCRNHDIPWAWIRSLNKEIYRTLLWKYQGDVNHPEIAKRNFAMKLCLGVFLNYVIGKTTVQDRLDIISNYFPCQKYKLYPSGMDHELTEFFEICCAINGEKEIIDKYDDAFNCVKRQGGAGNRYKWRERLDRNQYFVASFLLAKGIIKKRMLHQHAFEHPADVWRALA